jgi:microsomal dipeptidase-like Zn-dependent dipeptidase
MFADLHAHYPMRVVEDLEPRSTLDELRRVKGRKGRSKLRAILLRLASMFASHRTPFSDYRITPEHLHDGHVSLALSVLYRPGEELGKPYTDPPESKYFDRLLEDLEDVEEEVRTKQDPARIRIVHNRAELDACPPGATALVHAVEGSFHVGDDAAEIDANISKLADLGVGYVTVAHLLHRQIAKVGPAIPFLHWGWVYNLLFPKPRTQGLTPLGEAAIRACVKHRVLIDVSHMHPIGIAETVAVLDKPDVDPNCDFPLISTHAGYRFGGQKYMHDDATLLEIKRRDGVVGLILAQYQLNNGVRRTHTSDWEQSWVVIRRHIDKIADVTGSLKHVAFGSDFDGFIKPTMSGLEHMGHMAKLAERIQRDYPNDADLITHENALRVLRKLWA